MNLAKFRDLAKSDIYRNLAKRRKIKKWCIWPTIRLLKFGQHDISPNTLIWPTLRLLKFGQQDKNRQTSDLSKCYHLAKRTFYQNLTKRYKNKNLSI